jgi:hypothetical protein
MPEPACIYHYLEFEEKLEGNLREFIKELEETRVKLKKILDYTWDNNTCRFSNIYGTEFKFSLNEEKAFNRVSKEWTLKNIFTITFWDAKGQVSLGSYTIPSEGRDTFIKHHILDISERWTMGEVRCSDCKKWIKFQENRDHSFYAAIFCEECWLREWKAKEAKENYN